MACPTNQRALGKSMALAMAYGKKNWSGIFQRSGRSSSKRLRRLCLLVVGSNGVTFDPERSSGLNTIAERYLNSKYFSLMDAMREKGMTSMKLHALLSQSLTRQRGAPTRRPNDAADATAYLFSTLSITKMAEINPPPTEELKP